MKRIVYGKKAFLGAALAMTLLLMPSCKDRFNYDHLETVEMSGQWKLPIGSVHTTLGNVLKQLNDNQWISSDENGNLQVAFDLKMDDVIKGSDMMSFDNVTYKMVFKETNPYPYQLEQPIDTFTVFEQLATVDPKLVSFQLRSGLLSVQLHSNVGDFQKIVLRSDGLRFPDGSPWQATVDPSGYDGLDLSGVYMEVGEEHKIHFTYEVYYQLYDVLDSKLKFNTELGFNDFVIRQISGYLESYEEPFAYDTTFSLSLDKIMGRLKLMDTKLKIQTKNTFDLNASLQVDDACLYGGGASPSLLFSHYPMSLQMKPSLDYSSVLDETLNLEYDTRFDAVRLVGKMVFNPDGLDELISVYDTSALGVSINAQIPFKFNIPGVHYLDTIDLKLSEIETPEIIQEVLMNMAINSELPFNIQLQMLTFDSVAGCVTDSLLTNTAFIAGSFDGNPAKTTSEISVTRDRLKSLFKADKLILRFGLDTDDHDILLNLDNSLEVTLKADLIYGGEMDLRTSEN